MTGAWALDLPGRFACDRPAPGLRGAREPVSWFDTLVVTTGAGGGWDGFDAALVRAGARAELTRAAGTDLRPRADLMLGSGSRGLSDHALSLARGDTLGGIRLEAASGVRDGSSPGTGALAGAGRDQYDVSAALVRGPHRFAGAFAHRRSSATLRDEAGEQTRGEGGNGRYQYRRGRWQFVAAGERGYDRMVTTSGPVATGVRIGDENAASLEAERDGGRSRLAVRWAWRDTRVRSDLGLVPREGGGTQWLGGRWRGPLGDGRLEATLGVGRAQGIGGVKMAPSLAWDFTGGPWAGRLFLERVLTPVRTDLAAGQAPFLQDTWAGGIEAAGRAVGGARVEARFLTGRTRDRAVLGRIPLEALALRDGIRSDAKAYDFGLLSGEAVWRWRHAAVGLEGFVLARDDSPLQPRVDPGRGGRGFTEARFTLFRGDLHVRPRLEAGAIGPRASEATPSRAIPGFVTLSAGLELQLEDAVVLIEGRNLGGQVRSQVWVDPSTGVEALGSGRELRTTLTWRLWD